MVSGMDEQTAGVALGLAGNIFMNAVTAVIAGVMAGGRAAVVAAAIGGAYSAWLVADSWLQRRGC